MKLPLLTLKFIIPFLLAAVLFSLFTFSFVKNGFDEVTKRVIFNTVDPIILHAAEEYLSAELFLVQDPQEVQKELEGFYRDIQGQGVFQMNIWNYEGKLFFSTDNPTLVGKVTPPSEEYRQALFGRATLLETPGQEGQKSFEVYTPVPYRIQNRYVGVIELQPNIDKNTLAILSTKANTLTISILSLFVILAILIMLLLYFSILLPIRRLRRDIQEFGQSKVFKE